MEQRELLCKAVEAALGSRLQTPKDYDALRERIFGRLRVFISPTTLKRVWGYLPGDTQPRWRTLDTLAQFIGYADYDTFCRQMADADTIPSSSVASRHIDVSNDLIENDFLTLTWQPNRICDVRYLGDQQFRVTRSENTRLRQGDYFQCSLIIEGEPLYLSHLLQGDNRPTNYVCGKQGGIRFEINRTAK